MAEFHLPLSQVRCMNCANKIKAALTALPNTTADVDTKKAKVSTEEPLRAIFSVIEDLGYGVGQQHSLPLAGLSCGRCVAKVQQAFDQHPLVSKATVTKHQLDISGLISTQEISEIVTVLGYRVEQQPTITLALSGLSCGKCVAKVEKALGEQADISQFSVTKNSAVISSALTTTTLIEIIEQLGFQATIASPEFSDTTANTDTEISASTEQTNAETNQKQHQADIGTRTATQVEDLANQQTTQFLLTGMTCASCVSSVEKAILSVAGVLTANINLAERTALVSGTAADVDIITAVIEAGYGAEVSEDEHSRRQRQQEQQTTSYKTHIRNAIIALSIGVPLMAWGVFGGSMMIDSTASQMGWGFIGVIALVLLVTTGRHFYVNAYKAFLHHRASMDTLVALGTGAAWVYSTLVVIAPDWFPPQARHVYYEASAMILGLITLGHALEAKARTRTSQAIERLIDLQPQTAIIVRNGEEIEVELDQVQKGMLVRLRPGAKVPVDGVVEQGDSYIDESMLTGEPLAVNKQSGDTIHAGTINQNGSLLFKAEQIGNDTMLARIIQLVRQAQSSKPALAKLADSISAIFVPAVMIIATVTAMAWYYFGPQPSAVYMLVTATTVLIIACPCALGLATPMSVTVGIGRAAEYGVLIRDAEAMQVAANIDTVVLDKTGTITEGKPRVTETISYSDYSKQTLLSLAASLELHSEHPLAKAFVQEAQAQSLTLDDNAQFKAIPGLGVVGNLSSPATKTHYELLLGNAALLEQHGISTEMAQADNLKLAQTGATVVFFAVNQKLAGVFAVSDPLRADSAAAISRLQAMKLNVVMLTGDTEVTAEAIAKQAGIDRVIAGVLPDGKAQLITDLQQQGQRIAMVGDGINDAPALAQAEVGLAMGSGSDVAIESAQFTLMRHSLHGVADALQLSQATLNNMKQNLFGAFIYNSLGIPIAAGLLFPFTGTLLSPVVAGAAMALSSITVVSNANRLRLFTPNKKES
ncbi:copper-transporting ATPase [Photobacterium swingsii]|uniref:Copper-exporting P-type ATPase n=1 Tax=Photobacterium swingsii TaxID=680026 RepID=A0A0J8VAK2_9GAMM|nr:cation transporter [Photobacterium swingsii]KMV29635.1 copper-transporting ATPase [Photobacterium swingsii]PSW26502.1 copper-translocating P-type ATPase [Photobacterium swingsii]